MTPFAALSSDLMTAPFAVLRRGDKTFDILRQDRSVTVSIDRLKPAVLPPSSTSATFPPADPSLPSAPAAPIRTPPPDQAITVWTPPAEALQREYTDADFPPLPPAKYFKTTAGRISSPPVRFRP